MTTERIPLANHALTLADEAATVSFAQRLANIILTDFRSPELPAKGAHLHLRGDLGAGKTSFARAFLRQAGITGRIKSPSYALIESYNISNLYFYHLDFYRFSDSREWVDAGFRDILESEAIVLIEWPEQAGPLLPAPDLDIHLLYQDAGRRARLTAYSKKGQLWLTTLASQAADSRDAN